MRFNSPTFGWAAGDTSKTVRDIIQNELLGPPGNDSMQGTGMIPEHLIKNTTTKLGIANAVETIFVKHTSGGNSTIDLKSYDQGRESFQGTARHYVWLDEEPPQDVVIECLLRIMTTHGIMYTTATPLQGLTEFVLAFLPDLRPAGDTIQ